MRGNQSKSYMIKDWHLYQHYKKGNKNYNEEMKWFKLYGRNLMQDKSFMTLEPDVRDTLLLLWVIASQYDGALPSAEDIAFKARKEDSVVAAHINFFLEKDIFIQKYDEDYYAAEYDCDVWVDKATGETFNFPKKTLHLIEELDEMYQEDRAAWLERVEKDFSYVKYLDGSKLSFDIARKFCKAYRAARY